MASRKLATAKAKALLAALSTAVAMGLSFAVHAADIAGDEPRIAVSPFDKSAIYRGRVEGDTAMAGRDYAVAASFYADYKASAQRANDLTSLKDAFERQIDALILARLPDQASEAIAQFEIGFPNLDADSLGMWKADIYNLSGRSNDAVQLLQPLIERLPSRDPRRVRAMSALAQALEGSDEPAKAAAVYASIQEEAGENSPLRKGAFIREMLCLASSGQTQKARERLLTVSLPKGPKSASDELNLLNLFITLKEFGPTFAETAYSQARMELKDSPNLLAYNLASAFGSAWQALRQPRKALDCYRDAFAFAPSRIESCEAARLLMNCMNSLELKAEAADFAMRHLELFKGSAAQADMKLQAARLLVSAGRLSDAIAIYTQLAQESPFGSELCLAAAKECARAQTDNKDIAAAAETIRKYYSVLPDKGECAFLLAEILARGRSFIKAGEAYMIVASTFPKWRERALYESMRSYMDAGNAKKALEAAETILREFDSGDIGKDTLYQRARIFEMDGDLDRACDEYVKFAESNPNMKELAPKALYKAGRISFTKNKFQDAERRFAELAQRYPTNSLAPNAAFWRIHTFYSRGDELSADRETWFLVERYPDSEFAFAALFSLAASCSDSGLYERAENRLNSILEMPKAPQDVKARAVFEKVLVAFKSGNVEKAFQNLDILEEQYKSSPYVSDGYFLRADILKESGDYAKASDYYKKARERVPNSLLDIASKGGLADCLFCLGAPSKDPEQLGKALDLYHEIIARADAPVSFKSMSLYKAGRCQELKGDSSGALDSYKSLIYRFQVSSRLGEQPDAIWAVKAADALLSVCFKRGGSDDLQSAADALAWLRKSALLPERDLKARSDELEKARRRL